jgi:23S rRNA pseudouridine1911/1915/1917 synthase
MDKISTKEVKIIYQDKWLMVVDKPAGMVTTREHSLSQTGIYLEDWIADYFPNTLPRQGIAHRLDKDTSGLVVVARDLESWQKIKSQFKNRTNVKKYLALAGGDLPFIGDIKMPIKRSRYVFGKFAVDPEGKFALTEYKVIRKLVLEGRIYSLVEINLKTGRTHQIRVHFAYMGWPLYGDTRYGGISGQLSGRQFLHAGFVEFVHPKTGKQISFTADLPQELNNIISA